MKILKYLLMVIALLVTIQGALAFAMPYTVWGEVTYNGKLWDGKSMTITDTYSGVSETVNTNEQGKYQFEISGINENYRPGDKYKIDICQTDAYYKLFGDSCFKSVTIVGDGGLKVDIQLVDSQNTVITYICWDGTKVFDKASCPSEPVKETCPACAVCSDTCTDYTKVGIGIAIAVIIALIGFIGGGIKIYKNRLGVAVMQHLHKGVTSYHDPNIKHTNVSCRHRLWKNDPAGCCADVKKINEGIFP